MINLGGEKRGRGAKVGFPVFILVLALSFSSAYAAMNVALSDQGTGVKNKTSGEMLASGNLKVDVYDQLNGGNLIYSELFSGAIVNGSWNIMLGENTSNPLPLEFGKKYFKDYQINGEDASFVNSTGDLVPRQFFYSPLGDVNTTSIANQAVTGSKIATGTIIDAQISDTTNLTLGEKITFTFGGIIDNIVNGWIRITGNLNVTGNVTANKFIGEGSGLTNLPSAPSSYPAANITPGTFGAGNYIFPDNLNVVGNLSAARISGDGSGLTNLPGAPTNYPAANITAGTFGAGNYVFPDNVTANTFFGNHVLGWENLTSFPAACSAGQAITQLGGTPTCSPFLTSNGMASEASYLYVNGTRAMTGALDLGSANKVINMANGTAAQDAVTKSQLDTKSDVSHNHDSLYQAMLPVGTILMYNGVGIANVTDRTADLGSNSGDTVTLVGWKVANGNSGTPNLTNRFIRGEVVSGNTGGTDSNTLTHTGTAVADHPDHSHNYTEIVQHTHSVNVTDPGHAHLIDQLRSATTGAATTRIALTQDTSSTVGTWTTNTTTTGITASTSNPAGSVTSGQTTTNNVTLTHSVTQPSDHTSVENRPAYYSVIFIIKVS